ncbi:hypothetical protein [Segniliparus rugosus]|uniref:Uncharacterized protein n=1 Tax=Segniliparus rugosus (strain ATCC BAA-974 / DSM 45345 / CCUG 50838 / CIP 108380 / JCM 13579 / CDC 945) TaxID=679197 RepID=U1N900_SEGRC|nr:hypothetical protein [Segniliparus rugosus]ERG69293.1 hypothetical protein HMPREF9336_04184 [Segniliparus rugosus ATCC BAA-974]
MTGLNGKVGVNTDDLLAFGQKIVGKAEEAKALGLAQLGGSVDMPESATAAAVRESGEARGSVSDHAHARGSHAGAESALAAQKYVRVEEHNAQQLRGAVEPDTEYRW